MPYLDCTGLVDYTSRLYKSWPSAAPAPWNTAPSAGPRGGGQFYDERPRRGQSCDERYYLCRMCIRNYTRGRVAKVQKNFFHCLLMFIEIFLPTQRDAVSSKKTRLEHFPQRSRPRSLYANKELIVNAL